MSYDDRIVFPDEVENVKAAATSNAVKGKTMADDDRIVFPEVENMKAAATGGTGAKDTTADFDYDRVVFPDEVEEVKAKAAAAAGDNSVEAPEIDPRNKLKGAGECECANAPQFDLRFHYHHNGSKLSKAQCTGGCISVEAPQFDLRFHYRHKGSNPQAGCCSIVKEPQFDLGPISPR